MVVTLVTDFETSLGSIGLSPAILGNSNLGPLEVTMTPLAIFVILGPGLVFCIALQSSSRLFDYFGPLEPVT